MKISLDSSVIIGIWQGTAEGVSDQQDLNAQQQRGEELLICGVVYVELSAHPGMTRTRLNAFLTAARIALDLNMPAAAWEAAADANHTYQQRRRASGGGHARRLPADFLIGAHALHRADALYTRNPGDFADFPRLTLMVPL